MPSVGYFFTLLALTIPGYGYHHVDLRGISKIAPHFAIAT